MGAFSITTMFAFPIGLGTLVMSGTNPEVDEAKIANRRLAAGLAPRVLLVPLAVAVPLVGF